ncbi:hypothetical protein TRIP_C21614 [Candidatus Zixiibacteriota bacterium]|nr:hypothetical protein TRIP_C21614 [candidate division Zixibacteria bacterium]
MKNRTSIVISLLLTGLILGAGCKKDQEQVKQLAQETQEAEAKTSQIDSNQISAATEQDSSAIVAQETPVEPEKTPDAIPEAETAAKTSISSAEPEKKAEPESHPTSAMPPRITEGYTVQIGSTTSRSYAEKVANQYTGRGYQAYISEVEVEGVPHFRIRIGSFGTVAEARQMGEELAGKFGVSYWIDKNLK